MILTSEGYFASTKAPGETIDYGFDWTDWLQTGETIATSNWSADAGVTLSSPANAGGITSTFVSGGTLGTKVVITNTITTSSTPARIAVRTIDLSIKRR